MASLIQIEANQQNAKKSTGPQSPEGKEAVRFNSLKTGIYSLATLIPGEDPEEYKAFSAGLTASCHPADAREEFLVGQMVCFGWRLKRLMNAETEAWVRCFERIEKDPKFREDTKHADSFYVVPQIHDRLQRVISSVQRNYRNAAADLDRLQAARAKTVQSQPQPQLHQPVTPEIGFVPSTYINHAAEAAPITPIQTAWPAAPVLQTPATPVGPAFLEVQTA
jgi:hypothetical protein